MSLTSVTRRDGTTGVEVRSCPVAFNSVITAYPAGWHLAAGSGRFGECAVQPGQTSDGGRWPRSCRQGGGLFHPNQLSPH